MVPQRVSNRDGLVIIKLNQFVFFDFSNFATTDTKLFASGTSGLVPKGQHRVL